MPDADFEGRALTLFGKGDWTVLAADLYAWWVQFGEPIPDYTAFDVFARPLLWTLPSVPGAAACIAASF